MRRLILLSLLLSLLLAPRAAAGGPSPLPATLDVRQPVHVFLEPAGAAVVRLTLPPGLRAYAIPPGRVDVAGDLQELVWTPQSNYAIEIVLFAPGGCRVAASLTAELAYDDQVEAHVIALTGPACITATWSSFYEAVITWPSDAGYMCVLRSRDGGKSWWLIDCADDGDVVLRRSGGDAALTVRPGDLLRVWTGAESLGDIAIGWPPGTVFLPQVSR